MPKPSRVGFRIGMGKVNPARRVKLPSGLPITPAILPSGAVTIVSPAITQVTVPSLVMLQMLRLSVLELWWLAHRHCRFEYVVNPPSCHRIT